MEADSPEDTIGKAGPDEGDAPAEGETDDADERHSEQSGTVRRAQEREGGDVKTDHFDCTTCGASYQPAMQRRPRWWDWLAGLLFFLLVDVVIHSFIGLPNGLTQGVSLVAALAFVYVRSPLTVTEVQRCPTCGSVALRRTDAS